MIQHRAHLINIWQNEQKGFILLWPNIEKHCAVHFIEDCADKSFILTGSRALESSHECHLDMDIWRKS